MSILTFHDLGQSFGADDIFVGLGGSIPRQAKIGLVGPNGIGKTTLLRLLAGLHPPTAGSVYRAKGARIGYLQQEAERAFADTANTVYGEMLTVFADLRTQAAALREMEARMATDLSEDLLQRYGSVQQAFELAGGYEYEVRIQQVLTGLGFPPDQHDMPLHHCSGGQKTRALLARLLLERPDLLILDEPTNHLDVQAVEWLEGMLRTWEGALLVVSHDRYFLDQVADMIWEMSRSGIESYRGNYTAYLGQREERWERRDKEFEATQERFLRELDFVKRNIARDSATDQAKGRLRRLVRMVKAVELGGAQILQQDWLRVTEQVDISKQKWTVLETERHIRALQNPNPRHHQIKMSLQTAVRGGNIVLRTKGLGIGYPGTPLFEAEDIELLRQERAALIGANGTGKSTFLRTLLEDAPPMGGEIRLGANIQVGYYAQAHDMLDPDHTVLEELVSHQDMPVAQARSLLARFLFRQDDVFKPVRALSGGERGRLALAILSLHDANLLLMDEPTNHLDIPAQEALEEALLSYPGTVILVSHDRYLVNRLATQIWALDEGRLHVHKGGYASFLAARQLAAEKAKDAAQAEAVAARPRAAAPKAQKEESKALLARTEQRIAELEAALEELSHQLVSATTDQAWDRVRDLDREYKSAQKSLDALLHQWEGLAA